MEKSLTYHFSPVERKEINYMWYVEEQKEKSNKETKQDHKEHETDPKDTIKNEDTQVGGPRSQHERGTHYWGNLEWDVIYYY